jgi:predicted lipoprotein with Yx(FWY)xxD motif
MSYLKCCLRCRPPRPGNHFHPPDPASQALAGRRKGQEVMTTRKIRGRGGSGSAQRISSGPARLRILLAACSSAGASLSSSASNTSSPAAAAGSTVKTATVGGVTVLASSKGFTLYSFAPDMPTTSKCNGTCAQNWPPVQGPVTAAGVTGTFGTIKHSDGSIQATFDGHPLYSFAGDTAPGQAKGNGLNAGGGLWHEVTTSGTAPAAAPHRAPAAEATGTEPDGHPTGANHHHDGTDSRDDTAGDENQAGNDDRTARRTATHQTAGPGAYATIGTRLRPVLWLLAAKRSFLSHRAAVVLLSAAGVLSP